VGLNGFNISLDRALAAFEPLADASSATLSPTAPTNTRSRLTGSLLEYRYAAIPCSGTHAAVRESQTRFLKMLEFHVP